jgi:hypothetical protein
MKKLKMNPFAVFVLVVILAGVFALYQIGLRPKPVAKIDLSIFPNEASYVSSIKLRLNQELKQMNVLVLGIDPKQMPQINLVKEFIRANTDPVFSFNSIYIEQGLLSETGTENDFAQIAKANENIQFHVSNFYENIEQNLQSLAQDHQEGKKILIITANIFSTDKIQNSVPLLVKDRLKINVSSFFTTTFPRKRDDEKDFPLQCQVEGVDQNGLGALSCLILQRARSLYRKNIEAPAGSFLGIVDQVGLQDYVLMFRAR